MPGMRAVLPDFQDYFHYIINVALGVDAAGDREADEVHLCCGSEHQRADFYGANSAFQIQLGCQRYSGKLICRDVGEEGAGIEIDGVSAWGWTMGTPWLAMWLPR